MTRGASLSRSVVLPCPLPMPDPIMYQEDAYVVLETNQPEQILTVDELLNKLQAALAQMPEIPRDLQRFSSLQEQARSLLETVCELDVGPGQFLQWYIIRLDK